MPYLLRVYQGPAIIDVVAEDDEGGREGGVGGRGCGVIEVEEVVAVVEADGPGEGLGGVVEEGEGGCGEAGGVGAVG